MKAVSQSKAKVQSQRIMWTNDGVRGGKTSMAILVEWLSNEANYNRWKGGDKQSGMTKGKLADGIRQLMIDNGIRHRKAKDIIQKISVIESSYRDARDWLENTGQGVVDEDSIRKEITRRCTYFYELDDVMRDRPSSQALTTSDDVDINNDESSNTEFDDDDNDNYSLPKDNTNKKIKRKATKTKLDEWAVLEARTFQLKEQEMKQKKDEHEAKQYLDERRFAIEERQAQLNIRLLEIKREEAEMELRVKKVDMRKRLKTQGWTTQEIDEACPMD
ncbi:hypothetical protein AC1031_010916 [Aphanomyces cochlioides]|nr:hypothetical protein AC1031_010916 [Aphanomyces cochlioides]